MDLPAAPETGGARAASGPPERAGPWFVRHPVRVAAVASLLFAAVTVWRFDAGDDLATGSAMLYVLPVSLVALAWGRVAGIGAGVASTVLLAVWVRTADVGLSVVGLGSVGLPLLVVGFLLGDAAVRLRRAGAQQAAHVEAELRHRQAVEVNDLLVQGMAASKWSLEAGRAEEGLQVLEETMATGQGLVSQLIADAGAGDQVMR